MLSLNYENINHVMTQILKHSRVSFCYVLAVICVPEPKRKVSVFPRTFSAVALLCNCRSISTESIGKIFVILVHWNYLINL